MILSILTFFIFWMTLLGYRRWIWWLTVFDFFRLQYAVCALILLIICAFTSHWILFSVNLLSIILNIYRIRNFIPNFKPFPPVGKRDVLCINVFKDNEDFDRLRKVLKESDPEVLLLMEVTDALEENLEKLIGAYEYRLQTPVRDGFSICLLSKQKMHNPDISFHGPNKTPLLHAEIDLNGTRYHVFSAHPKPALNKQWSHERHIYFRETIEIIKNTELPPIVLGDFNSVPWERHFVEFCERAGLKSTAEGYGYPITWPTYCLPMGIPMDHILLPKEKSYSALKIGPYAGSDHYPIAINI